MEHRAVQEHVEEFLFRVDAKGSLSKLADVLSQEESRNENTRKAVELVRDWITNLDDSEAVENFAAISYLQALEKLSEPEGFARMRTRIRDGGLLLRRVKSGIAEFEPGFMQELLKATKKRASENPSFARKLENARNEILEASERHSGVRSAEKVTVKDIIVIIIIIVVFS